MAIIGLSIGNVIGGPLIELMLEHYGVRGTLALLGAIHAHRIPLALQFRSPERFKKTSKQLEVGTWQLLYFQYSVIFVLWLSCMQFYYLSHCYSVA